MGVSRARESGGDQEDGVGGVRMAKAFKVCVYTAFSPGQWVPERSRGDAGPSVFTP